MLRATQLGNRGRRKFHARIHRVVYSEFMRSAKSLRLVRVMAAATLAALICGPGVAAQTKKRAPHRSPRKAAAPIWTTIDCGSNVELRLSSASSTQGALVQAELLSGEPLSGGSGTGDAEPVPF